MRPFLERPPRSTSASWSMLDRRLDDCIPFQWHHHAEYELTLTLNSEGQRFIGEHVGDYGDADLVLVGPNLPHTWASRAKLRQGEPHHALVFWFRKEWLEAIVSSSVEFSSIGTLLQSGLGGLAFSPEAGRELTPSFKRVVELEPLDRLLALLQILNALAADTGAQVLALPVQDRDHTTATRLDRVLAHLHQHYAEELGIEQLAEIAALSVSGLHRLFTRHTQLPITAYIMRLRIGEACARLAATDEPISYIADAVGYNSLANFNRQFKSLRGTSPRDYRTLYRQGRNRVARNAVP